MRALVDGHPCTSIDVLDRGLMYGDGVFRTMRLERGAVRSWRWHQQKLSSDCTALGIACPDGTVLLRECLECAGDASRCVVKVVVTRGSGGRGYSPRGAGSRRIVMAFPLPTHAGASFEEGVEVRWCRTALGHQPLLAGLKHLNRLENVLARAEWSDPRIAEGLMLDIAGRVVSGTMSNLFLLEGERLATPDLSLCGVAGVQRARLLHALQRAGQECVVAHVGPDRLLAADAVLLMNSVIGLWRVARLEGREWSHDVRLERFRLWLDREDD